MTLLTEFDGLDMRVDAGVAQIALVDRKIGDGGGNARHDAHGDGNERFGGGGGPRGESGERKRKREHRPGTTKMQRIPPGNSSPDRC